MLSNDLAALGGLALSAFLAATLLPGGSEAVLAGQQVIAGQPNGVERTFPPFVVPDNETLVLHQVRGIPAKIAPLA